MRAVHLHLSNFINESRILKETTSLVESGMFDSITIVAFWKDGLSELEQIHPKITVIRLRSKLSGKQVAPMRKLPSMLFLLFSTVRRLNPDVINLHQVKLLPIIPVLWMIGIKAKLVYDAHELETETQDFKNASSKHTYKLLERLFIRSFSLVIVVSKSIESWYRIEYSIDHIVTVKNCPIHIPLKKRDLLRRVLNIPAETIIFLYQGFITSDRGIDIMLKCFSENIYEHKCVVFLGYGDYVQKVKSYAESSNQIYYLPAVPPHELLHYTASADVGLSLGENVCLNTYYSLPNKIFEYTMANVPMIVSNLVEIKEYVLKYGIGVVLEEESSVSLSIVVDDLTRTKLDRFKPNFELAKNENNWSIEELRMIEAYKRYVLPSVTDHVRA